MREAAPLTFTPLDTNYLGVPGCTHAFVVHAPAGLVLVECGCAVAWNTINAQLSALGIAPRDFHALFVTHVHLDHSGCAGHFAREGVPVHVHPRGARHLHQPARLIASSRAVHGARYEEFYGDPIAIDPALVHATEDGASVSVAGLRVHAIETLGHAKHHHAWAASCVSNDSHPRTELAPELLFVGDVLGMITPSSDYISIPVPPTDIDIPAWRTSIAKLRALPRNTRAVLTHGGERTLGPHLDAFVARMNEELPFLASLVELNRSDPAAADARYQAFLEPRARARGVSDELLKALLAQGFRAMNLAGITHAIESGTFAESVE